MSQNKIAVIKTGGKQYKVKPGSKIKVEKLKGEAGDKVKFDTLLISDEKGEDLYLGNPFLDSKIEGEIVEHGRGDKIRVVKYKNKTRYRRNIGHKQPYTEIVINSI